MRSRVLLEYLKILLGIGEIMKEALLALEEIYINNKMEYPDVVNDFGENIIDYLLETRMIVISYDGIEEIFVTNKGENVLRDHNIID